MCFREELVGKFPSQEEILKYHLEADLPYFLPTSSADESLSFTKDVDKNFGCYLKYLKKIGSYFKRGYVSGDVYVPE